MNAALPIIEDLDRCLQHAERAAWLLLAPFDILLSCEMTIRNRLMAVRFQEGLSYLDDELSWLRSRRRLDGIVPVGLLAARGRMREIAGAALEGCQ